MNKFKKIFSRADESILEKILGKNSFKLIELLETKAVSISRYKEISLEIKTPKQILSDQNSRNLIFDLLREDEADEISKILGNKKLYSQTFLSTFDFKGGSEKEEKLFNYFEIEPPEVLEKINISSKINVEPNYGLFPHQKTACGKVLNAIKKDYARVMLHMPTGSGKTRTAMHIITSHIKNNRNAIVVWLVFGKELCEQAADEFEKAWSFHGDHDVNLYRFWGNSKLDISEVKSGFLVAGFGKFDKLLKKDSQLLTKLSSKVSLVIVDEAHSSVAPTYSLIIDLLTAQNSALIGLTATPGRTYDDMMEDEILSKFYDSQKVELEIPGYSNAVEYLVEDGYLAKTEFKSLLYDRGIELSKEDVIKIKNSYDIPDYLLSNLADSDYRNLNIILTIEDLIKLNHIRILLFATTVEHSDMIASILRARGILSFSITSNTHDTIRTNNIKEYKSDISKPIVLCNYGVLTTGFDAPKTSAAIIARPTQSLVLYSQMVGRAMRGVKAKGNKKAVIYTTVDFSLPGFDSIRNAFTNWNDVFSNL
jgi:DNA repair protein RadD